MKLNSWGAPIAATVFWLTLVAGATVDHSPTWAEMDSGTSPVVAAWDWLTAPAPEYDLHTEWIEYVPPAPGDTVLAFPGIQGWGATSIGTLSDADCRALPKRIHHVTNTNTSGAGSLDQAIADLSNSYLDYIAVWTGGNLVESTAHSIGASCVFILGQMAGGDGFQIVGHGTAGGIDIDEPPARSDIVITGLTITGFHEDHTSSNCVQIHDTENVVFAYNDVRFCKDQNEFAAFDDTDSTAKNITIAFNLFGADFAGPGLNLTTGASAAAAGMYTRRVSAYGNILYEFTYRSPLWGECVACEWINNLTYNWLSGAREASIIKDGQHVTTIDFLSNHFLPGPGTSSNSSKRVIVPWIVTGGLLHPDSLYLWGNISDSVTVAAADSATADQGDMCRVRNDATYESVGGCPDSIMAAGRQISGQAAPIDLRFEASELVDSLTALAGPFQVNCYGNRAQRLDNLTAAWMDSIQNDNGRTSAWDSSAVVAAGVPTRAAGSQCSLGGSSGAFALPDSFEVRYFGSAQSGEDTSRAWADPDGDGYPTFEEYAFGFDPTVFTAADGTETPPSTPDIMPAFPGAVGDGAPALDMCRDSVREGAWPLKVWIISVGDSGTAGSFLNIIRDSLPLYRDAYNIITFAKDTFHQTANGGEYDLTCTYIAGQTGQGGGWSRRASTFAVSNVSGNRPHDVVIRYMTNQDANNFTIASGERIYVDHFTGRWGANGGGQYNITTGGDSASSGDQDDYLRHTTLDYILAYEPRRSHPTNIGLAGSPRDAPNNAQITLTRSMHAGIGYRSPNASADTMTVAEYIGYNWTDRAGQATSQSIGNFFGVFYHTGPSTQVGNAREIPFKFGDHCQNPISGAGTDSICTKQVYIAPNRVWYLSTLGNADTLLPGDTRDYWRSSVDGDSIVGCFDVVTGPGYVNAKPRGSSQECENGAGGNVPLGWKSSTPIVHTPAWEYPPDTTALDSARVEEIIAEVGNSRRVDCYGDWEWRRDAWDSSRVAWFRNNWLDLGGETGLAHTGEGEDIADEPSSGGIEVPGNPPSLGGDTITVSEYAPESQAACTDTDSDGMPDLFETRYGFNTSSAADNDDDPDGDGWLNIEEYVNGTDPWVFTNPDGSEGGGPPPGGTTYSGGRYVFAFPLEQTDTLDVKEADTTVVYRADMDSVPPGTKAQEFRPASHVPADGDSVLVLTCDALSTADQDSAWVDSVFAAWSIPGPKPWQVNTPCP